MESCISTMISDVQPQILHKARLDFFFYPGYTD